MLATTTSGGGNPKAAERPRWPSLGDLWTTGCPSAAQPELTWPCRDAACRDERVEDLLLEAHLRAAELDELDAVLGDESAYVALARAETLRRLFDREQGHEIAPSAAASDGSRWCAGAAWRQGCDVFGGCLFV